MRDALRTHFCDVRGLPPQSPQTWPARICNPSRAAKRIARSIPQLVFSEPSRWISNRTKRLCLQIVTAGDKVHNRCIEIAIRLECDRIEQHAIYSEIAADNILCRIAGKAHRLWPPAINVNSIITEGGHLNSDHLVIVRVEHKHNAKVGANGLRP